MIQHEDPDNIIDNFREKIGRGFFVIPFDSEQQKVLENSKYKGGKAWSIIGMNTSGTIIFLNNKFKFITQSKYWNKKVIEDWLNER